MVVREGIGYTNKFLDKNPATCKTIPEVDDLISSIFHSPGTGRGDLGDTLKVTYWYVWYQDVINLQLYELFVTQQSPNLFLDLGILENLLNVGNIRNKLNFPKNNNLLPVDPTLLNIEDSVNFVSTVSYIPTVLAFLPNLILGAYIETGTLNSATYIINLLQNSVILNYLYLYAINKGITQALSLPFLDTLNQLLTPSTFRVPDILFEEGQFPFTSEGLTGAALANIQARLQQLQKYTIKSNITDLADAIFSAVSTNASIGPLLGNLRVFFTPTVSNYFRIVSYTPIQTDINRGPLVKQGEFIFPKIDIFDNTIASLNPANESTFNTQIINETDAQGKVVEHKLGSVNLNLERKYINTEIQPYSFISTYTINV